MLATSPARRRFTRPAALVAVAIGGAATLVACQKPLPEVTFQSGSRSVLVSPSTYCFDTSDQQSCRNGGGEVTTLRAQRNDVVQISVPRTIALQAWIATAYTLASDGTTQPIEGGGTDVIRDNHFGRVPVPNVTSGSYLLAVNEFRGDVQTGTWTIQVDIAN